MNTEHPDLEASFLDIARWIRATVPGSTVEDCRARQALIDDVLDARRVWRRDFAWHTAQLDDGRVILALGASTEEAELKLAVLHDVGSQWVVRDPEHAVFFEYFPEGHRHPEDVDRVFPVAPPRRPRGEFTAPVHGFPTPTCAPTSGLGR